MSGIYTFEVMNKAYLLLGSNLGDKFKNLAIAIEELEQRAGIIVKKSSIYETAPWGYTEQPNFVNQATLLETKLSPTQLLYIINEIEQIMGREPVQKWQERLIDIDILFYNDQIIDLPELKIPHPYIQERNFALTPLNEITPNFLHPTFQKTISDILSICKDKLQVNKVKTIA